MWVRDTVLSYDWVRKDLEDAVMRLDAEAEDGSINLEEIEGGTGLGSVSAGEDVTITTDGDLTDARTDEEKEAGVNNIEAGGDAEVNVPNGEVGTIGDPEAGTDDEPIKVSVGGEMTVNDQGDVNLVTDDDLTVTIDSEEGVIHVDGEEDLNVHVEGDIIPGEITFYRLQSTADAKLRAYIAEGEILPVATQSFGSIGVFAIPEMGRFYRHVLIEKGFPHHGAVAFGKWGRQLFEVFKYIGVPVEEIGFNQPAGVRYPSENPWG